MIQKITTLAEAIRAQMLIDNFLRSNGIRNLVGDYGEVLAHQIFGGKLMPPVNASYDILHDTYGRIQVKTRRLADRLGNRASSETRAVLNQNSEFDYLFHLVLTADFKAQAAFLAPRCEVERVTRMNSGKISLEQTSTLPSAVDFLKQAQMAEIRLQSSMK